jgi:hypothetical protein
VDEGVQSGQLVVVDRGDPGVELVAPALGEEIREVPAPDWPWPATAGETGRAWTGAQAERIDDGETDTAGTPRPVTTTRGTASRPPRTGTFSCRLGYVITGRMTTKRPASKAHL